MSIGLIAVAVIQQNSYYSLWFTAEECIVWGGTDETECRNSFYVYSLTGEHDQHRNEQLSLSELNEKVQNTEFHTQTSFVSVRMTNDSIVCSQLGLHCTPAYPNSQACQG